MILLNSELGIPLANLNVMPLNHREIKELVLLFGDCLGFMENWTPPWKSAGRFLCITMFCD
jgi:hypothetical protein